MNSALSSLTEAYTDSENEDNHEDSEGKSDPEEKQIKAQIVIQPKKNRDPKITRLVSYNDNEYVEDASDDEPNPSEAGAEEIKAEKVEDEDKYTKYFKKYGFHLPPEPKTPVDKQLQANISNLQQKISNSEFDLNQYIQEKKEFRNPSIYDKLIQFCDINELGTNFPPEIFDVSIYGPESFYEELAKAQKLEMDKLEKQKKEVTKTVSVSVSDAIKRKSKWDQQAPSSATSGAVNTSNSSSSAKTIIISSTGSLKKPKL